MMNLVMVKHKQIMCSSIMHIDYSEKKKKRKKSKKRKATNDNNTNIK